MKLRPSSHHRRDQRITTMLDRHVRDQRSAAPIVTRKPELRRLLVDPRVG